MIELKNVRVRESAREIKASYDVDNGNYEIMLWHSKDNGYFIVNVTKGLTQQRDGYTSFISSVFEHSKTAYIVKARYSFKKLQELWESETVKNYINTKIQAMLSVDTKTMLASA